MVLAIQAGALFALSLALALPVTRALSRAWWPRRAPRAALVLWQAIGLAGGLSLLTAGVTLTAAGTGAHWRSAVRTAWRAWPQLGFWGWVGLVFTVCMAAWLVIVAVTSTARVVRARRGHRERLAMIARAGRLTEVRDRDVLLVEHPVAAAYCLPGIRPQVVVTRGALTTLTAKELGAVLAHERAHARGHHHLVTQPFIAWARTFPFLPHAREGLEAVDVLVEMLADQLALRECEPQ
ncbi:MAG TPA: M56 family metallopeptidase, partial [Ruania sp.]|nr:M56 family metallopeptidase [Ruania sp.]